MKWSSAQALASQFLLACVLCCSPLAEAAHLTTTNAQNSGQSWTNLIWKIGGTGTAQAAAPGNTYELLSNGIAYGNNQENTRVRNPLVAGLLTFPGDSLKLNPNTEIEMKRAGAGKVPTLNFPGVNAAPGLILSGGSLTVDDDEIFTLTGRVQVVAQSYIATGEDGGGVLRPNRALILAADLTGAGNLVWFQGGTDRAQQVTGNNAGYTGTWILKAGWLVAGKPGSLVKNSVVVDPKFRLPLSATIVDISGPAIFEPAVDLVTSGYLALTNGGWLKLHQNCAFQAMAIEGVPLAPGLHTYADLQLSFPTNILPNGSGSISVQSLGGLTAVAPRLLTQPQSGTYEPGATILLTAAATGTLPLSYRWERKVGGPFVPIVESPAASGTTTRSLRLSGVSAADSTEYRVVVTNLGGLTASQAATLAIVQPSWPVIARVTPAPGTSLSSLATIQVTFDKTVTGVEPEDLLVNGNPAATLTGSGSNYVFGFSQPPAGPVSVGWDPDAAITDLSGRLFDASATWQYTLADAAAPALAAVTPARGAWLTAFSECAVVFSEPVMGVDAADLRAGNQAALSVTGSGVGPYHFTFPSRTNGVLQMTWSPGHGIIDSSSNAFAGTSWAYTVDPANRSYTNVVLNEFLSATASTNALPDEDGDFGDWIELRNRGTSVVNLAGWGLSDDPDLPAKWVFPATNLASGQYLVVFASGKDRRIPGARLHTNFRLKSGGGYLGLFQADYSPAGVHEYHYPEQRNDISYGLDPAGLARYFALPTPGSANPYSAITGAVESVHLSVGAGFFAQPFNLVLATPTSGATVFWTSDGSDPGVAGGVTNGTRYSGPIRIERTTPFRAVALAPNQLPSRVTSRTFLFIEDIIRQPNDPAGYPVGNVWTPTPGTIQNGSRAYYQMDPVIVEDPRYAQRVREGLLSIPALSLQLPVADLFDPVRGIYTHPQSRGPAWERACSMELIFPGSDDGIQIDSSLQIQGGTQRDPAKNPKHSFRVNFKGEYGPAKLDFPVFPESPVRSFDRLVLDGGINMWWHYVGGSSPADQRYRAQCVRDQFTSDLMRAIGHPSFHGRFFNVFLNGLYWGIHYVHEVPDESFAAEHFGGLPEEYDVLRNTTTFSPEVLAGDLQAWNTVLALANPGLTNNTQYAQLQQYVDIDNFIDYMVVNHWAANEDWPHHNWYVLRQRKPGAGFKFMIWDAEHVLKNVNETSRFGYSNEGTPAQILNALTNNAEFRLRYADHLQKHFFNGGVFYTDPTPANAVWDPARPERNVPASYYMRRIQEIDSAIVAESARWGGYLLTTNYTRDDHWLRELHNLLGYTNTAGNTANFFPLRSGIVLNKYRSMGLWPTVQAPQFSRQGGAVPAGFALALSHPNASGSVYYTTNGEDPRVFGTGQVAPWARLYTNGQPIVLGGSTVVKARVLGSTWSPLAEAAFTLVTLGSPLCIAEVMFNPPGGTAFEYFEIQNLGPSPMDLGGWSCEGVDCSFPSGTVIPPQGVIVLASSANPGAFAARYPGVVVSAWFGGSLANEGDKLGLRNPEGQLVVSVDYTRGGGWPAAADGLGYSLEIVDPNGDPDAPSNWRASTRLNGTPGQISAAPAPSAVRLSEVMADNGGRVPNGASYPDWFELSNAGSTPLDLSGWSVSDNSNPRKYVFPPGTSLPANGYLVVWSDTNSAAPGMHAGFSLEASGESLFLFDERTNRVDAVTFGQQLAGYSVARFGSGNAWGLAIPTPGAANSPMELAAPTNLVINEWLANAAPGDQDWIELHNRSASRPAALQGLSISTSRGLFHLQSLSFVPPSGFVRLLADEGAGPLHLDVKLKSEGDRISLQGDTGEQLDEVRFGLQLESVSRGRLPDGSNNFTDFPGTASPGAPNYLAIQPGPVLNELMARNSGVVYAPGGRTPDWVELYNPNGIVLPLQGMTLARRLDSSSAWSFPAGVSLPAGGYLRVWLDESEPPSLEVSSHLNAGFSLAGVGDTLLLLSTNRQILDSVSFGFQIPNRSVGRIDGEWVLLAQPTPAQPNSALATLGSPAGLRINEWLADSIVGPDWFELHNSAAEPVSLSGLFLADDPSLFALTNFPIAPLSFIAGRGWVRFVADGHPTAGPDHAPFSLDRHAGLLRLHDAQGALVDAIDYILQETDVSEGRLPDGADAIARFPSSSSPGSANYLPLEGVRFNEVLTHTDPPLEDAIELFNSTGSPMPIGGWYLSDTEEDLTRYRIPDAIAVPARGFQVFYEYQFGPAGVGLNSAHGGQVFLSQAGADGRLTGYRAHVSFGATPNGVSFGAVQTSAGLDFAPASRRTFGVDAPTTLDQFRLGQGQSNAPPLVGPVVISEICYQPAAHPTNSTAESVEEFLELANTSDTPVALYDPAVVTNRWKLAGGVEFTFPAGTVLGANDRVLVVGFDPQLEPEKLAYFRTRFGLDARATVCGPFRGRLSNESDTVMLLRPDVPQGAAPPDAGFVPYVLVERVCYTNGLPWPTAAGFSLQRQDLQAYGNEPLNWTACPATAGRANCGSSNDLDGDGLPDDWEAAQGLSTSSGQGSDGAAGDPDQDGLSNLEEWIAGTHPRDASSRLALASATVVPEGVKLRFHAASNRTYSVQYRLALGQGPWMKLQDILAVAEGQFVEVLDPVGQTAARYYRLVTPQQP
jgi:hypothetical protein